MQFVCRLGTPEGNVIEQTLEDRWWGSETVRPVAADSYAATRISSTTSPSAPDSRGVAPSLKHCRKWESSWG